MNKRRTASVRYSRGAREREDIGRGGPGGRMSGVGG